MSRAVDDPDFEALETAARRQALRLAARSREPRRNADTSDHAGVLDVEIAEDERQCVERLGEIAPTMYLGMDGAGVPMRTSEVGPRRQAARWLRQIPRG